jgi:hypothetical protein
MQSQPLFKMVHKQILQLLIVMKTTHYRLMHLVEFQALLEQQIKLLHQHQLAQ